MARHHSLFVDVLFSHSDIYCTCSLRMCILGVVFLATKQPTCTPATDHSSGTQAFPRMTCGEKKGSSSSGEPMPRAEPPDESRDVSRIRSLLPIFSHFPSRPSNLGRRVGMKPMINSWIR